MTDEKYNPDITEEELASMDIINQKFYVQLGMRNYGGGFLKALGEAVARADRWNAQMIRDAFDDKYWFRYLRIGYHFYWAGHEGVHKTMVLTT